VSVVLVSFVVDSVPVDVIVVVVVVVVGDVVVRSVVHDRHVVAVLSVDVLSDVDMAVVVVVVVVGDVAVENVVVGDNRMLRFVLSVSTSGVEDEVASAVLVSVVPFTGLGIVGGALGFRPSGPD
jgi:hypothetical protein